jgi:hypothetical protein
MVADWYSSWDITAARSLVERRVAVCDRKIMLTSRSSAAGGRSRWATSDSVVTRSSMPMRCSSAVR